MLLELGVIYVQTTIPKMKIDKLQLITRIYC